MTPVELKTPLAELEQFGVPMRIINRLEERTGAVYIGDVDDWGKLLDVKGMELKSLAMLWNGLTAFLSGDDPLPGFESLFDENHADVIEDVQNGTWVGLSNSASTHTPWDDDEREKRYYGKKVEAVECMKLHEPAWHNGRAIYLEQE